ncbi:IclR family transcriptional regulator [Propylenella binzhouense]|uniref:IclR family transcriptional regulator n=1 Tax=Propylenella binzhouense TaxID=2555902 RepID=A0A964WVE5_9HYPH|nr:IclR family transcriptional regulator [Propylenella binzhouense]MYZ49969.1 IclR family transcriptional regulator [Propylenella binzhouense]
MQSHVRMLAILDLFDERSLTWTVDEIHARLGYTRSTLYRYLKVLTDAGFLTSLPGLGYTLGPRIVELDYKMRASDPLIQAAAPVMAELVADIPGVALLCRIYRQKVLCVHQESSNAGIRSTYERGRARPLLRGAASLAILASLPNHQIGRLYKAMPEEFAAAGLGSDLAAVRSALKVHRQAGHVVSFGQVSGGVMGVAAPLFDARPEVIGSLNLTVADTSGNRHRLEAMIAQVSFCARVVNKALARGT